MQARPVLAAVTCPGGTASPSRWGWRCLRPCSSSPAAPLHLSPAGAPAGAADLHVGPTPGPLLPGPAGMAPRSLLGLGPTASHGVSVSATRGVGVGEQRDAPQGLGAPLPP